MRKVKILLLTMMALLSFAVAYAAPEPTHYWSLNQNTSDTIGTFHGTDTTLNFTGNFSYFNTTNNGTNGSTHFNGEDSTTTIGTDVFTNANLNNASMSFWINLFGSTDVDTEQQSIINFEGAWIVRYWNASTRTIQFTHYNGVGTVSADSTFTPSVGQWAHIVVVYERNVNKSVYVNGVLRNNTIATDTVEVDALGSRANRFGSGFGGSDEFFNGTIDEVKMWVGYPLNATDVGNLYNCGNASLTCAVSVPAAFSIGTVFGGQSPANYSVAHNRSVTYNVSISNAANLSHVEFNWNGTIARIFDNSTLVYLTFDNNSLLADNATRAVDLSVYSNNLSFQNGSVYNLSGRYGSGLFFDGVNDFANFSVESNFDFDRFNNFSICAWIAPRTMGGTYKSIFAKFTTDGVVGVHFFISASDEVSNPNTLGFVMSNDSSTNDFVVYVPDNNISTGWQHVCVAYSGTSTTAGVSFYINNVNMSKEIVRDGLTGSTLNNRPVNVGHYGAAGLSLYFDGLMDDYMIFNRTISSADVDGIYSSTLQKYNLTDWRFFVNKTGLNSATGLTNYSLNVSVRDAAGRVNSTETRYFSVNNTLPNVSQTAPNNTIHLNANTVVLSWNSTDTEGDIINFTLFIDSNAVPTTQLLPNDRNISVNYTPSVDGVYYWFVRAYDTFGNYNQSITRNFSIDTQLPNIAWTTPGTQTVFTSANYAVEVSCNDTNLFQVDINVTNQTGVNKFYNVSANQTGTLFNWTYTFNNWTNDGSYNVSITCADDYSGSPKQPKYKSNPDGVNAVNYYWDNESGVNFSVTYEAYKSEGSKHPIKNSNFSFTILLDGEHIETGFCFDTTNNVDRVELDFTSLNDKKFYYRPNGEVAGLFVIGDKYVHFQKDVQQDFNISVNGTKVVMRRSSWDANRQCANSTITGGLNLINSRRQIVYDITAPNGSFISPTPSSYTHTRFNNTIINVSVNDSNGIHTVKLSFNNSNITLWNTTGLAGYWNFNNNTGDISGYGNNPNLEPQISPDCGTYVSGKVGTACNFTVANANYINISDSTSLRLGNNFTLSAWIKWVNGTSSSQQRILTKLTGNACGAQSYAFIALDTPGAFGLRSDDFTPVQFDAVTAINDNNWHWMVATHLGDMTTIYIDGVRDTNGSQTGTLTYDTCNLVITSGLFNGTIDEVRIWNRTLSASEIWNIYDSEAKNYTYTYVVGGNATGNIRSVNVSSLSQGIYNYSVWLNDSLNNANYTETRSLNINVTPPIIFFAGQTPNNFANQTANNTIINVSINITISSPDVIKLSFNNSNITLWNTTGLVGYWNLNNNTGDISGYANNGVNNGTNCSTSVSGKIGTACAFDGNRSFINVSISSSINTTQNAITIASWIRPLDFSIGRIILNNHIATQGSPVSGVVTNIEATTGAITFQLRLNGVCCQTLISATNVTANNWSFFVSSWDGSTMRNYINGVQDANTLSASGTNLMNRNIYIGINADDIQAGSYTNQFNGTIDEVRIWNRTLSASEIWNIYDSEAKNYTYTYVVGGVPSNRTVNISSLAQGTYSYYAWANDSAGNSNQTSERNITIDNTAPVVNLISPLNGTSQTADVVVFQYNVSDATLLINNCTLLLDSTVRGSNLSLSGGASIVRNISYVESGKATHSWNVTCYDSLDNAGISNTYTFTLTEPAAASTGGGAAGGYDAGFGTGGGAASGNICAADEEYKIENNLGYCFKKYWCGDGLCNNNETRLTCSIDCASLSTQFSFASLDSLPSFDKIKNNTLAGIDDIFGDDSRSDDFKRNLALGSAILISIALLSMFWYATRK